MKFYIFLKYATKELIRGERFTSNTKLLSKKVYILKNNPYKTLYL